ncbi:MAG: hypothetical protein ABSG80_13820 [Verrucomicrobiota bacterium]|jgi:hypothetical protein
MKTFKIISTLIVAHALCCVTRPAAAQSNPNLLPVYQVTQAGPSFTQATNLVGLLNIPVSMLVQANGLVSFVNPTNFLFVPTTPVTNATVISNLLAVTKNPYPANPISFQAIDFTALSNLMAFDTNAALSSASLALASSGLYPPLGTPVIGHAWMVAFCTNADNSVSSACQYLDTQVNFQFDLTNGYPLIGPGAQVQLTYGATGNVTHLLYSSRQLAAGPSVEIFSASEASNRVARLLPANAQINLQLVYWSPSFWPPPNFSGDPLTWSPTNIIPWYVFNGTINVTNPVTGSNYTEILEEQMMPATDDTNYVPVVNLSTFTVGNTQVVTSASASGGRPPYTYVWSGSDPTVTTNTGPRSTTPPKCGWHRRHWPSFPATTKSRLSGPILRPGSSWSPPRTC